MRSKVTVDNAVDDDDIPQCEDCRASCQEKDLYDDWELSEGSILCSSCNSDRRECQACPQEWQFDGE